LWPGEVARQQLAHLVVVAIDGLLAHDHEVGLLALHHRLQRARHQVGVQRGVVASDQDGAIGAHGQQLAQLGRSVLGADADHDHFARAFAALTLLGQAQRGFHRVLVERVDLPGGAGQFDRTARNLELQLGVGNALTRYKDLHANLLRVSSLSLPRRRSHGIVVCSASSR